MTRRIDATEKAIELIKILQENTVIDVLSGWRLL
jgi:hypothetical protein